MLQRIQSIYLFLAALAQGSLFLKNISFADFSEPNPSIAASTDGYLNIWDSPFALGATGLALALTVLGIFLYKNRKNQMRLVSIIVAILGIVGALVIWEYQKLITANAQIAVSFVGFIPLFLSGAFALLANRNIRKDELLVKSSDRLR